MTNTMKRILVAGGMIAIAAIAGVLEYLDLPALQWLAVVVVAGMAVEFSVCAKRKLKTQKSKDAIPTYYLLFALCYLLFLVVAAWHVGAYPWLLVLLLLIISAADIGGWLFGSIIGGDKMWSALSPGKTWSGQIAGIACGTIAAVLYGFIGTAFEAGHLDHGQFMPQLLWIGISISLLSQYGDLAASAVKRRMGIKDLSNILPGHGGLLDRFDGWIFVLPFIWLVMI